MGYDVLLFDLDGTLYDQACGYEENIHENIFRFMVEQTGGKFNAITTIEEAKEVWKPIFDKYNLTKRGLLGEGFEFDGTLYDNYIRRGAKEYIRNDPSLREFLLALPNESRKAIFTNAPESSALEILSLLGVDDLFEAVLGGAEFLSDKICKPERAAFVKVLEHLGMADCPDRICFFEDSFKNLRAGKDLGFTTVFVKSSTLENEGRSLQDLSVFDAVVEGKVGMELKTLLPDLFTPPRRRIDALVFDLDGTLYDRSNGYMASIRRNIFQFLVDATGGKFDDIHNLQQAEAAWRPIFTKYNNAKRGLIACGYKFDGEIYDRAIRQGARSYFQPDNDLRGVLQSLPQRKIVFTNAPESSASEILALLRVDDLFDKVIGTDAFEGTTCKPDKRSFDILLDYLGVSPDRVCMFEDSFRNLQVGKELGMTTVFVNAETRNLEERSRVELDQFDAVLEAKVGGSLREKLPMLWM
jgi:putative hydrolase of the HAD superfamily